MIIKNATQFGEQDSAGAECNGLGMRGVDQLPGVPCQRRPEIAVLVSSTRRTTDFYAVGIDLGLDLFFGHGRERIFRQ